MQHPRHPVPHRGRRTPSGTRPLAGSRRQASKLVLGDIKEEMRNVFKGSRKLLVTLFCGHFLASNSHSMELLASPIELLGGQCTAVGRDTERAGVCPAHLRPAAQLGTEATRTEPQNQSQAPRDHLFKALISQVRRSIGPPQTGQSEEGTCGREAGFRRR